MFSLLNVYKTNFDEIISINVLFNNIRSQQLFKRARQMIKSGVPCINLMQLDFDFKCMNLWIVLYNMGYFLYNKSIGKGKEMRLEDIKRSMLDYLSYKGDIIYDDFLRLNELTIYDYTYDYDDLFYLIRYSVSYYENSIYLYFIKNYILLSGQEYKENSENYHKVIHLDQKSIIREIYDGFLNSINKVEDIMYLENNRHAKVLKSIDKKDYLSLISYILNFLKYYFKELDIIDVQYYKDLSNSDDTSDNEHNMTYDHNIKYFICINKEACDFLVSFHVAYTFYEMLDASYYRIPGSPFNMKMVFIKYKKYSKVKLHITIDKNIKYFKDIKIYFRQNHIDNVKHKYRYREVGGYYHLVIFSDIVNEDVTHINDIVSSIKQIKMKIGKRKIHIM